MGCTWLWLIWIISKGLLQPERAQGTSGAASELGSSRLAVGGMETSFKYQELCNTAFKTIFKSSEGKFKFTEVMENSVTSTDVCLADSKNYVMSRPAQSHVTGVLITTTSYISESISLILAFFLEFGPLSCSCIPIHFYIIYLDIRTCFADLQLTRQD